MGRKWYLNVYFWNKWTLTYEYSTINPKRHWSLCRYDRTGRNQSYCSFHTLTASSQHRLSNLYPPLSKLNLICLESISLLTSGWIFMNENISFPLILPSRIFIWIVASLSMECSFSRYYQRNLLDFDWKG